MGRLLMYLWRSDVFASSSDPSSLQPTLWMDTDIPCMFNEVLDLKYGWDLFIEMGEPL